LLTAIDVNNQGFREILGMYEGAGLLSIGEWMLSVGCFTDGARNLEPRR
jgi:hypothetical protein